MNVCLLGDALVPTEKTVTGYGIAVDKGDSDFAKLLYGLGGSLDQVHLKDDGNHCTLVDSYWSDDIAATIVKVTRRKSRAKIMFTFAGRRFTTWVAAEIEGVPEQER